MNDENKFILLDLIYRNGSVNRLVKNGFTYEEFAEKMNDLISINLIEFKNEKIQLTELGKTELERLEILHKKIKKEEWIEPDFKNRVEKIEKNFIFVPRKNELSFLKD